MAFQCRSSRQRRVLLRRCWGLILVGGLAVLSSGGRGTSLRGAMTNRRGRERCSSVYQCSQGCEAENQQQRRNRRSAGRHWNPQAGDKGARTLLTQTLRLSGGGRKYTRRATAKKAPDKNNPGDSEVGSNGTALAGEIEAEGAAVKDRSTQHFDTGVEAPAKTGKEAAGEAASFDECLGDGDTVREFASTVAKVMRSAGPVVSCVLLNPNGTVQEEMVDTTPKNMPAQYEVLLGGRQATIVGQMHPSDVVMLCLEEASGQPYNCHQPLPGAHKRNVHGPILCLRMGKDDGEPRNYTVPEHLEFMQKYRDDCQVERENSRQEAETNDGMEYEDYYSTDKEDDKNYDYDDDDNDGCGYEDDINQYDYDDYDEDWRDNFEERHSRIRKPGLVEKEIQRRYQEKHGRLPSEQELAYAMQKVSLNGTPAEDEETADVATRKQTEDEDDLYASYYEDDDDEDEDDDGYVDVDDDDDDEDDDEDEDEDELENEDYEDEDEDYEDEDEADEDDDEVLNEYDEDEDEDEDDELVRM